MICLNINEFSTKFNKVGQDVNPSAETPQKLGQDMNLSAETPQKLGQDVNPSTETPQKLGQDVSPSTETSQKLGQDVSPSIETSQKLGQDVSPSIETPIKETAEVVDFSNLNKLENMGTDVKLFITSNLLDASDFTPLTENDKIRPFNKTNLSGLDNFSPILDNDKIGEVDFFGNKNSPGFIKNHDEGSISKFIEDSSDRDLPGNMKFTKLNKYEDSINSNPNGNFNQTQIDSGLQASNPLLQGHLESIGMLDEPVAQEVDFFSGDNSYFPTLNPAIVGFSHMFTAGDGSLLIENQDISSLDNLLNYRTFDFSSGQDPEKLQAMYENYVYDPRTPRIGVPSFYYVWYC